MEREVEDKIIEVFSEEQNIEYKETSAKDENDNVINELFQELGEQLYEKYKKDGKRKNSKIKKLSSQKSPSVIDKCCP